MKETREGEGRKGVRKKGGMEGGSKGGRIERRKSRDLISFVIFLVAAHLCVEIFL